VSVVALLLGLGSPRSRVGHILAILGQDLHARQV
jgi:hypothetical protein